MKLTTPERQVIEAAGQRKRGERGSRFSLIVGGDYHDF